MLVKMRDGRPGSLDDRCGRQKGGDFAGQQDHDVDDGPPPAHDRQEHDAGQQGDDDNPCRAAGGREDQAPARLSGRAMRGEPARDCAVAELIPGPRLGDQLAEAHDDAEDQHPADDDSGGDAAVAAAAPSRTGPGAFGLSEHQVPLVLRFQALGNRIRYLPTSRWPG